MPALQALEVLPGRAHRESVTVDVPFGEEPTM
jgi:hypothetical protein